ncbi:MAG TPA: HAMP domain-containing sensor histidine kinase [Ktedonobacteraceae bacterium]|nr:HAMP domain-containing sensor histidine kinase [Ktedonobacteraceae bacterium]
MYQPEHARTFLRKIQMFPLFLLNLSWGKRLLIVILSYALAIPGLWFFFPLVHNAASMVVPIICLCWFFRYRGLLISISSTALVMGLIYYAMLARSGINPDLVERAVVGLGISLLLGLTICWLRIAVDLMHVARQQTLIAEQERLLTLQAERHTRLAYEHQRQLNELKDQFLLHVNHELRTPLTVLGSSLELFKKYFEQMDPLARSKLLTQALANYEELVSLVNGVLNSVTITGTFPPPHCESVPVFQVAQEVLAHLDPEDVRTYTIRLQVAEEILVWADPQSLYHVLQNLLSNIFKYVPTQTIISIEATQPTPLSPVCLSIQDAGPGIPPEELPLLFEKFVRLKRDVGGPTRGTGLGLSICKYLVEAMQGHIWVESSGRMGEGSRFCITLPPGPQPSLLLPD